MPTSKLSIELYNHLKQSPKPLLNEICFYLKEEYDYDLSFIDINGVPAEAAHTVVEFLKPYPQGLNHLQQLVDKQQLLQNKKAQTSPLSPFLAQKKALLEKRFANLQSRYAAVFTQREATLNEGDKWPLDMQLEQLENQLKNTEHELSQL